MRWEECVLHSKLVVVLLLLLLLAGLTSKVHAATCTSPCVQILAIDGASSLGSTKNVSIAGVHAGNTLVDDVINGANSNASSISNSSLSWVVLGSNLTLDWHHEIFC